MNMWMIILIYLRIIDINPKHKPDIRYLREMRPDYAI